MNTVTVKINGVEYNLRGKENEKYLIDVAAYVDSKFKEIFANNNKLSLSSVAVLTAINIADELFKYDIEISELSKKKNLLEERHLALKERLREIKVDMDELAKEKNSEIERLKNIVFLMEEKLKGYEELKNENDELKSNLEKSNKDFSDKVNEVDILISENKVLKDEVSELNNKNYNLQQALNNCREEMNSRVVIEEYDSLKSKYEYSEKIGRAHV